MADKSVTEQKIIDIVKAKFPLNCQIVDNAAKHFDFIKQYLQHLSTELTAELASTHKRYQAKYVETESNQTEIQIGEDTIWFHLHPNLFRINEANPIYRFSYLKDDINRAQCAVINVYNFLTDTLINKRENDLGILIARIFINVDNHFIMETRRPIGILYNDLSNDVLDQEKLKEIVGGLVLHCLEHDLVAQPYDQVQTISYQELSRNNFSRSISGAKQLGFKFKSEEDPGLTA